MLAGSYTASPTISGKTVVIHGYGATLNAAVGMRSIEIDNAAQVRLLGLTLVNINANQGQGISCQPSQPNPPPIVALEAVTIDSYDSAVMAYPCTVTMTRSHLKTTRMQPIVYAISTSSVTIDRSVLDGGDGIVAEGASSVARITNSIVVNQTGPNGAFRGSNLFGQGAGSVIVGFSTVINSQVKCGSGLPRCAGGTAAGSCIDNSIIYNGSSGAPADTVEASGCTTTYSLVRPQSTPLGGANNQYGVSPMFKDFAGADYHLATGSMAIDAGDPAATNMIDFDGTQRPQGSRSDIGAFEFKP